MSTYKKLLETLKNPKQKNYEGVIMNNSNCKCQNQEMYIKAISDQIPEAKKLSEISTPKKDNNYFETLVNLKSTGVPISIKELINQLGIKM